MLDAASIDRDAPGVQLASEADKAFTTELVAALGLHRVWDRAALVMASAVAPSKPPAAITKRKATRRSARK